jgi:hypothetical protein
MEKTVNKPRTVAVESADEARHKKQIANLAGLIKVLAEIDAEVNGTPLDPIFSAQKPDRPKSLRRGTA